MDPKRAALYQKLQELRSVTNSSAVNQTSIVVDASKYIAELKEKVERLQQDVAQSSNELNSLPMEVKVETTERGFLINIFSQKNCPGLLVTILEAFDDLGLDVLDAKVSCSENFHLEAIGENEGQVESIDARAVKQAVLEAIRSWSENCDKQN